MVKEETIGELAREYVEHYIAVCGCETHEDIANVLSTLLTMCSLAMCGAVGQETAVARLLRAAHYIDDPKIGGACKIEEVH